MHVVKTSGINT